MYMKRPPCQLTFNFASIFLCSPPCVFSSLFQNGVVHRDLKLENILLDDNFNIKVGFFFSALQNGFACFVTFLSKVLEETVLWQQLLSNSIWQEAQGFGGWGKSTTGDESYTRNEALHNLGKKVLSRHPRAMIPKAVSVY